MAVIALCWYSMDDASVTATRRQASALANELELPQSMSPHSDTPMNFTRTCRESVVSYRDADGVQHQISAVETARRPELITMEVHRGDGLRVAQIKYYAARRTEAGQVIGSSRVRSTVSPSLASEDAEAARTWLLQFSTAYEHARQIAPSKLIRRIALACLMECATPIVQRKALYFAYVDQLAMVNRLRTFLTQVCDDADVTMLPIEDGASTTTFLTSADLDMAERITDFNTRLASYHGGKGLRRGSDIFAALVARYRGLHARVAEHEQRLSGELPTSHSLLRATTRLTRDADPTGYLLRVARR